MSSMRGTAACRGAQASAALISLGAIVLLAGCKHGQAVQEQEETKPQPTASQTEQSVPVVKVVREKLHREWDLPGQFLAYQDVPIHAKVEGYISSIVVDRGSIEVFGNGGRVALSAGFRPAEAEGSLAAFSRGGPTRLRALEVFELKSAWAGE